MLKQVFIYLIILFIQTQADSLPGIDYLKSGYDGLQILNDQLGQSKYPIFDFNPSSGQQNDFFFNGKTYKIPYLVQAQPISYRKESECEGVYYSFSDFQRKYAESINFSADLVIADITPSLKINHSLEKLHQEMTKEGKSVSVSHSYWAMYSLVTAPAFLMPLNPMFKQSLDMLNKMAKTPTSDTQQTIYNQVISSFGTHYVSSVIMGGSAKIYTTLNTSYLKTLDQESIKNEIHLDVSNLIFNLTYGKDTVDVKEKPSENFTNNSDHIFVFSPQVDHLKDPKSWATWESQVPVNPQPVNTTVSFISDLAFEYPEVQLHLKKTIEFYLKNARLPSFSDLFNSKSTIKLQVYMQKLIPGVDIVGSGLDCTNLHHKESIFELGGGTTVIRDIFINFMYGYDLIPLELSISQTFRFNRVNSTKVFHNFKEFVSNTFWENTKDPLGFSGFGSFSTAEYQHIINEITNDKVFALTLKQIHFYTLKMSNTTKPKFNAKFQFSLQMLPKKFEHNQYLSNMQAFQSFFQDYGTHVVVESEFGGQIWAEDWIESCLVDIHGEDWVKNEIKNRYIPFSYFQYSDIKPNTTNTTHLSLDFSENSSYKVQLLGGNNTLLPDQWDKWLKTVKSNPIPLNQKLVPIYEFLEDGEQKTAVKEAFKVYRQLQEQQANDVYKMWESFVPPKSNCCTNKPFQLPNSRSFKVESMDIQEETIQNLCPIPGYHGGYCPDKQSNKSAFKRQLQKTIPNMPSGIGISFDITTGELKIPAIELTYQQIPKQEQIWKDSLSDNKFIIADETIVQQVELKPDIKIFKNETELINFWLNATERGQWLGGQYSSSKDSSEIYEKFFKGEQQTSISQLTKNVVRLAFKSDNLKLNKLAQRAVSALPTCFIEEVYNHFLDTWGTHISVDTYVGGMIEKQTIFKECVYSTPSFTGGLSPEQVNQALNKELLGNQAEGYFTARRRVSIDHKIGGNPEVVSNWEKTISQNPALLKINRFKSWDEMVTDTQIKSNLQKAIKKRVETMKQKQQTQLQQIIEQRRQKKLEPKYAYAFVMSEKGSLIEQKPQLLENERTCFEGRALRESYKYCNLYNWIVCDVRYERDVEGRFRALFRNEYLEEYHDNPGSWVENGCSIAELYPTSKPTDLRYPISSNNYYRGICTDCVPTVYNTPNGNMLQCNCPAF